MFSARQGLLKGIRNAFAFLNPGTTALLSTGQAKFGPTSGRFPATNSGSYVYQPTSASVVRNSLPFTIECWYYQTANTYSYPVLVGTNISSSNFVSPYWLLEPSHLSFGVNKPSFSMGTWNSGTYLLLATSTISLNTWAHVAVVRTAANGCVMGTSAIAAGTGVLTVGTLNSGTISTGLYLTGIGVPTGTYITSNISGAGAGSTWNTNTTTAVSLTTITGNNFNLYVNGTNEARVVNSTSLDNGTSTQLRFGTYDTGVTTYNGYLDEFRFSSVARYFTNFTPATQPFIDDGDTLCLMHFDGANSTQVWVDDNT